MSIVAIRRYADRVEIASDTLHHGWFDIKHLNGQSLWMVDLGPCWAVVASGNLWTDYSRLVPRVASDEPFDQYAFMMAYREACNAFWEKIDRTTVLSEYSCAVVFEDGAIWGMQGDLEPTRIMRDYHTVGTGGSYAQWALYMGASVDDAVHCAMEFDAYSGGRIERIILPVRAHVHTA